MPLGTLEDWMRAPLVDPPDPEPVETEVDREHDAKLAQVETVLAAWREWSGDFTAFCEHVRHDLRVEIGKTMIANILFEYGARTPARRAR